MTHWHQCGAFFRDNFTWLALATAYIAIEERAQAEEQSHDPLTPATDSARYDKLGEGLEVVQRLCGHAAHQCLRDGDCEKDIESIKHRLEEMMDQEIERVIERVSKEDPEAASMGLTTRSSPKDEVGSLELEKTDSRAIPASSYTLLISADRFSMQGDRTVPN